MKVKFLKHKFEFIVLIFALIIALSFIGLAFIRLYDLWLMSVFGFVALCFILYELFIDKRISSMVIYSEQGIECKSFKKIITYFKWEEITEIIDTTRGRSFHWLTFIAKDKRIDVELTQKMYNVIMILCPYQNLKRRIDDMECFKWFHRKKKDKNSNDF